ncbi:glycoside hydrolase family 140 protein [Saccharicrinis sp. FJH62]|uniref:glycoside hydrolase family 140 protein n=1 Tax=Saccharicrinis sp. FJH62 TaxID=3344657 RepID=UPI0035D4DA2B
MIRFNLLMLLAGVLCFSCAPHKKTTEELPLLKVSENGHYMVTSDGDPFFWLGDTGWLLFTKLNREEAEQYLEDRREKGFNVIQVMVLHSLGAVNVYGDSALINDNASKPLVTEGSSFSDPEQYDYWDNIDYVVDKAAEKGLYMALVPVWGGNVRGGYVSREQGKLYGEWLAKRYRDRSNIIWLNGGDTFGSDSTATWNAIGNALKNNDPNHLITFHPRGRMQSSDWFENEPWLDFNMVQSGHRRYDQDDTERNYGEDNWRYIQADFNLKPAKPTIDGEPSYEGIPQGLHDTTQPYWKAEDVRRYAYWSVFAGACGFTYGHSAIMQFYKPSDEEPAYGAREYWTQALEAPGAKQMGYLKDLMLSRPYLERVPDQSLIAGENGEKYDHLQATRGTGYAYIYTYTGRNIPVNMTKFKSGVKALWFDPKSGEITEIGKVENSGTHEFDPPGEKENGNDWVLVLEEMKE